MDERLDIEVALLAFWKRNPTADATVEAIATEWLPGTPRESVANALQSLVKLGRVFVVNRANGRSVYRLRDDSPR